MMRSGGNNVNYFPENKLAKMANLVQFKSMLMFCLEDWGAGPPGSPLSTTSLSTTLLRAIIMSVKKNAKMLPSNLQ